MTRDDIIRMAREAGLEFDDSCTLEPTPIWYVTTDELERFATLVAEREREACAKVVEVEAMQYSEPVWAIEIVNDIRARGQE